MDKRAVRDHIQVLIDRFKRKKTTEERESGITPNTQNMAIPLNRLNIAMEFTESNEEDI